MSRALRAGNRNSTAKAAAYSRIVKRRRSTGSPRRENPLAASRTWAGSQGLTGTSRLPVRPASWTVLDESLLPCSKSGPHRVADTVLSPGQSPHRIDAVRGRGRSMLAGVHRGRSTGTRITAGEPSRSTGSSPPFRFRDRVASHCPRPGGLALPGGRPPPIPARRSRTRPTLSLGRRLAAGRLLHPRAFGDRVGCSGRRMGSRSGRGLGPAVAGGSQPAADTAPAGSGAGLGSVPRAARCGRGGPGAGAGSAIGWVRLPESPRAFDVPASLSRRSHDVQ